MEKTKFHTQLIKRSLLITVALTAFAYTVMPSSQKASFNLAQTTGKEWVNTYASPGFRTDWSLSSIQSGNETSTNNSLIALPQNSNAKTMLPLKGDGRLYAEGDGSINDGNICLTVLCSLYVVFVTFKRKTKG